MSYQTGVVGSSTWCCLAGRRVVLVVHAFCRTYDGGFKPSTALHSANDIGV